MRSLSGQTLFITGASRGIGKAIALRAAADGANVVIASKSSVKHPKLPGTIHSAAEEIEAAGGQALAIKTDIRYEDQVEAAVDQAMAHFGGIDILVNNASAIYLAGTLETPMKRYDLMAGVNGRGAFLCSQKALPHLLEAANPHILNISPPLSMKARWFKDNCAYTMAKYGMSMCVLGMAAEFADAGVAVNALWPRTAIDTAALAMLKGVVEPKNCRKPEIVADAARAILTRASRECTGNFFIDDEVLRDEGVEDMDRYAVDPAEDLFIDFFLD
ncbi:MAG: SDR family oxidoreductase [Thermoanaerobaculia bacterium]